MTRFPSHCECFFTAPCATHFPFTNVSVTPNSQFWRPVSSTAHPKEMNGPKVAPLMQPPWPQVSLERHAELMQDLCKWLSGQRCRWRAPDRSDQPQRDKCSSRLLPHTIWALFRPAIPAWWRSMGSWSAHARRRLSADMTVVTESRAANAAQREAYDRILGKPYAVLHGLRQQQWQLHRA